MTDIASSSVRERRLLGLTIASGMVVLVSHTGGPLACSTTIEQVEVRHVDHILLPGQDANLVLTRRNTRSVPIRRGTLLRIEAQGTWEGALVAFVPGERRVFITPEGRKTVSLEVHDIRSIAVLGEEPIHAHANRGANQGMLIGGLTGAAIGATTGGYIGHNLGGTPSAGGAVLCAVGFGVTAGGVGTGIGAAAGAISGAASAPKDRPQTLYAIGPSDWYIGEQPPPLPAATAPAIGIGESP